MVARLGQLAFAAATAPDADLTARARVYVLDVAGGAPAEPGGFMTCYLTSRDSRFAAAVAGGVVADLVSMAGTSDAGHFLSEYELASQPWSDPPRYAALSPLAQVGNVRTPTLVMHGTGDMRCPVGQAEQWHTALRERGVPTRLVLYPAGRLASVHPRRQAVAPDRLQPAPCRLSRAVRG